MVVDVVDVMVVVMSMIVVVRALAGLAKLMLVWVRGVSLDRLKAVSPVEVALGFTFALLFLLAMTLLSFHLTRRPFTFTIAIFPFPGLLHVHEVLTLTFPLPLPLSLHALQIEVHAMRHRLSPFLLDTMRTMPRPTHTSTTGLGASEGRWSWHHTVRPITHGMNRHRREGWPIARGRSSRSELLHCRVGVCSTRSRPMDSGHLLLHEHLGVRHRHRA